MNKLKTIIVDDEPLPLELLSDYAGKTPYLELLRSFTRALDALAFIQIEKVDLILLDIEMPELTGIQLAKLVNERCKVIFTTAHPNFALGSYELGVVDYLLKPISFDRFLKAAQKAYESSNAEKLNAPEASTYFFVKSDYKMVRINFDSILFIEGRKEYVSIHTIEKKILILQNLKRLEELLPGDHFVRVHKSFIIALNKIEAIERSQIFIKGIPIAIGETYRENFLQRLRGRTL